MSDRRVEHRDKQIVIIGAVIVGAVAFISPFVDSEDRKLLHIGAALVIAAAQMHALLLSDDLLRKQAEKWNEQHPRFPFHPDPEVIIILFRVTALTGVAFTIGIIAWLFGLLP